MDPTQPRLEDPAAPWRAGRRRGAAALVVVIGLIWSATAVLLTQSRAAAVDAALTLAQAQSTTAAQTLLRSFEAVNSLHDLVRIR